MRGLFSLLAQPHRIRISSELSMGAANASARAVVESLVEEGGRYGVRVNSVDPEPRGIS